MSADQASTGRLAAALVELLTDPLADLGLDLDAVEVTPAGKRRVVRVAVDQDGGVSLDEVAEATRRVAEVLDDPAHAAVTGEQPYTLEVSSRGVDRPLTLPRHWRRNADRLVKTTLADGTTLTGRVVAADDDPGGAAVLDVSGAERRVAYDEVRTALVQIEFNRKERS